jgi:glycosyltransferase involved in cell wall biosynthesis
VEGLVARGHEVRIFVPPTAEESYLPLSEYGELEVVPLADKSGRRSAFGAAEALFAGPHRFVTAMKAHADEVGKRMRQCGCEVVFCGGCRQFFAPMIARFARLPSVLYLQEPNRPLYEAMPVPLWLRGPASLRTARVFARTERLNVYAFDRVLCNSRFSRESLLRAYGLEAEVAYLGVDTDRFVLHRWPRESYVVGLGALVPAKRPDWCIRVLGRMPDPKPPLLWVGNVADDAYLELLLGLAKKQGVDFQWKLMVSDEELVAILNRASAMLYAPRLEPFGLAPLEANACGVPVVGIAEGGVRETIRHGANGLLADDEESAARALAQVLSEGEVWSERCRQEVLDRWTIDRSVDAVEKAIFMVLRGAANG